MTVNPPLRRAGRIAAGTICVTAALLTRPAVATADPTGTDTPDLASLQLTGSDVAPVIKWPLEPTPDLTVAQTLDAPVTGAETTSNPKCAGAVYAGLDSTYDDSGYTGFEFQELTGSGQSVTYSVISVAASFEDEDAAADVVAKTLQSWSGCHNQQITGDLSGNEETRTVNNPISASDSITVVNYISDNEGACSHAMTSKDNVVAEVSACRSTIGLVKQGLQLANKMLTRLPG